MTSTDAEDTLRGDLLGYVPVASWPAVWPSQLNIEEVPRLELSDGGEQRMGTRNVLPCEQVGQRIDVQALLDGATSEYGLDLGSPDHLVAVYGIVQRLYADGVANEQQSADTRIVKRDGEHPVEVLREVESVFLVGVNDNLGVGCRSEAVTPGREMVAKRPIVVDFAVEDGADAPILIEDGLGASLHVDHRQSPHPQSNGSVYVESVVVWTPVLQRGHHGLETRGFRSGPIGK